MDGDLDFARFFYTFLRFEVLRMFTEAAVMFLEVKAFSKSKNSYKIALKRDRK